MSAPTKISILGCGWLGTAAAEHFIAKGYQVNGSTTTSKKQAKLKQKGIKDFLITVKAQGVEGDNLKDFFNADILLLNIPPDRKDEEILKNYPLQMKQVAEQAAAGKVKYVLFISSTSVYPDVNQEVTEQETRLPEKDTGKALRIAEDMLRQQKAFDTTVLRLSGLVGPGRHPGNFLAGKTGLTNGEAPVNLIHQVDCVNLIDRIIGQEKWGETYNGCADKHPSRQNFYTKAAEDAGVTAPGFEHNGEPTYKVIIAEKVKNDLRYKLEYPDPMGMLGNLG